MLSPHELAMLHLIECAPGQVDINRPEFGALATQNLVEVTFGRECPDQPAVTARGQWVLRRLGLSDPEKAGQRLRQ